MGVWSVCKSDYVAFSYIIYIYTYCTHIQKYKKHTVTLHTSAHSLRYIVLHLPTHKKYNYFHTNYKYSI